MFGFDDDVVDRLREFEQAGASRAYLQHLQHRDLDRLEWIGREVVPAVA
jgi:hypothetical protein